MKKKIAIMMLGVMMLATPAISASASVIGNDTRNTANAQQAQGQEQVQGQSQYSKNLNLNLSRSKSSSNSKSVSSADNFNLVKVGDQKNNQTNNQTNEQNTTITYKAAKNIPGLVGAAAIDNRSPELMLNNEARLLDAAEAEIMSTIGKGYTDSYKYTENGVTAVVAYNSNECTVHVYPTGSSKGITPAVLDMVANKAVSKIGMKLTTLLNKYVSIENHSNGTGASASPTGSAVNSSSSAVSGFVGLITGNRGRTSQRIRVELVYVGGK